MKTYTVEQFGKDHWSLMAYCETREMDHHGGLDRRHLRLKNTAGTWKPEYGTRLFGYFQEGGNDASLLVLDHDDMDCLCDLEEAGLVENIWTGFQPVIKLTEYGRAVMVQIHAHKAEGKHFASFVSTVPKPVKEEATL